MTKPKTILVVDDDQDFRTGLLTMLQRRGYRTLEAEDGREAQQLIDGHCPDLVILDMMMPRWGGFAVLEHFQHKPDAPPFIMISANEGEKHKAYARKVGAADYLCKPFSLDRLLQRLEITLRETTAEPAPTAESKRETPVVRFCCADCGARIKAPVQMLGQTRPCPGCKRPLVVQRQPPEDEGPSLVWEFN